MEKMIASISTRFVSADPMTVDDALFQMELVGHDFYLFLCADTGQPTVVVYDGYPGGAIHTDGMPRGKLADLIVLAGGDPERGGQRCPDDGCIGGGNGERRSCHDLPPGA